jgi:tetratricopeptide (TPR) repeat protein
MSALRTVGFIVLALLLLPSQPTRGSEPDPYSKLKIAILPRKSTSPHDRGSAVVQLTPQLVLGDGQKKIIPTGVGHIYLVEKDNGTQLLLFDLNDGTRGWVTKNAVVPLSTADQYFSRQVQTNPRDAFFFLMRGVVRFENDDLAGALADVDQSLRLEPKNVSALLERAYLRQWHKERDLALADVNQAIALEPRNSYAYVERAVLECNSKEYDKCLHDLDQAIKLGSQTAVIPICRGIIQLDKGDRRQALAEFDEAIKADPKHPDAYCGLAWVFLSKGDTKKAIAVFDRAIEADPKSPESHGNRAIVHLALGKYDKAVDDLDDVIKAAPNSARALKERAWILATCPQESVRSGEQAVISGRRACEITGWKEPHCMATLAAAYAESGDFESAVDLQQKAIGALPLKSRERHELQKVLDRYKAKKPYRHLNVLQEIGIASYKPAKKSE